MRILLDKEPFPVNPSDLPWNGRGQWPCNWVTVPSRPETPYVSVYRLAFTAEKQTVVRVHVTADERYILRLDGEEIGRGSDRGDAENWFFETYELELSEGEHLLTAQVWALGEKSPFAQISASPGFLLCPQESDWQEKIGTGKANWEVKLVDGFEFTNPLNAWGTGWNLRLDARKLHWRALQGLGEGWQPVEVGITGMVQGVNDRTPVHLLRPSTLPPMLREIRESGIVVRHVSAPEEGPVNTVPIRSEDDLLGEHVGWMRATDVLGGDVDGITIPADSRRRVILDMGDYVCAYPEIDVMGGSGAQIRLFWQESLYTTADGLDKGNRDEIEGKFFNTIWHNQEGIGDLFITDGEPRTFTPLWWHAGRYLEVLVETAEEPLTIRAMRFVETHYPYEFTASFESSDGRMAEVIPIMHRVLEMCSHETYMDCPYFEQLQYVGDTRLQVLVTYTQTTDDRLPRKALRLFDASRRLSGLTQSRYPSRVLQLIPPFSLWYVAMLHDFALWQGDMAFVRELISGARSVLDAYRAKIDSDGLLGGMDGWNFVDWVPGWQAGMPKDAAGGKSGIINLHLVYALRLAAELEEWLGEPEMAARHRRTAKGLMSAINRLFWNEERGLYANDLEQTQFSEHAQCLALLSGALGTAREPQIVKGLLNDPDLDRTTIYFSHYLFETYGLIGRPDLLHSRLDLWFQHPANGLKTTVESPEPTRSDCHAWGAHPLFHYFATFLGIRPVAPGFAEVEIRPQLGPLTAASGVLPTPKGNIEVSLGGEFDVVTLPEGIKGRFVHGDHTVDLWPGETIIG